MRGRRRIVQRVGRRRWAVPCALFLGAFVAGMALTHSATLRRAAPAQIALLAHTDDDEAIERTRYFERCGDARAAGAAPIRVGRPGYRSDLDGDADGWACEPFR